jgi:hypothetical protein
MAAFYTFREGREQGLVKKEGRCGELHEKWNPTSCEAEFFSSK